MQHQPSRFAEVLKSLPSFLGLVDEPHEELVQTLADDVDVRRIAPLVLAQVNVAGDPIDALQRGVERIDRYLDGVNDRSETLARTTELRWEGSVEGWRIARVLSATGVEDLPRPRGREVRLVAQPEQVVATISCATHREDDRQRARVRLFETLRAHPQLRVVGETHWVSRGPSSIAFLQRSEARVQLDAGCIGARVDDAADTWALSLVAAGLPGGL